MDRAIEQRGRLDAWGVWLRSIAPGALTCIAIAFAAEALSKPLGQPSLIIGLVLGLFVHPFHARLKPGIDFAAKPILEIGIALLGFRVSFETLSALGLPLMLTVIGAVFTTIALTVAASAALGVDRRVGFLAGGATSICGTSACLAIAAALPRDKVVDQGAAVVVVGVTLLSTIAMALYPYLVGAVGLEGLAAGAFLGGSIHNVPQAVGAGYVVSPEAGDGATMVKLFRVALIMPVTIVVAAVAPLLIRGAGEGAARAGKGTAIPWFIIAYLVAMVINSTGAVPKAVSSAATTVSLYCLVTSVVAIGAKTSVKGLFASGLKPLLLVLFATLCLGTIVFTAVMSGVV